jgi:esterase/lipase
MRRKKWWLIIPLALAATYLLGPKPGTPEFRTELPAVPEDLRALEQFVATKEAAHNLKPNNQARIIWADDSTRSRTTYSILYLHGFTASQAEGDPVHKTIAKKFGCNLFLSRLAEHGIDTIDPLLRLKAVDLWESAKEAYAIASQLGNRVIVMGTSTGATLALMLAARYPQIHAQLLLSPNIRIFDENAWIINNPWGLQIARNIVGSDYVYSEDTRPVYKQYWSYGYRLEAVAELQELLEDEMNTPLFGKIRQPTLMLYYYKDPVHQDSVVKVDAMLKMFDELSTPDKLKKAIAMPDAGNHVLGSYIKSADVEGVTREITNFMKTTLQMKEQ